LKKQSNEKEFTMKIKTPYQRLLEAVRKFHSGVFHPHTKQMWSYPKDKLKDSWSIADLYERVAAAGTLGYDVILQAKEDGLYVMYRKRPDDLDWFIGY
jgi:hypothetical protein